MVFLRKRYFRIFHEVIYKEAGRKDVGGVKADRMIYGTELQSQTVLSPHPDATSFPFGENATAVTALSLGSWASSVPVAVSQMCAMRSSPPVMT